ncbi:MAG: DUF5050 domain-containing protein [Chloroflexota bacterium]
MLQPTGKTKEKRKGRPRRIALYTSYLVSILLVAAMLLVLLIWGIRNTPQPVRPTVVVRLPTATDFPTALLPTKTTIATVELPPTLTISPAVLQPTAQGGKLSGKIAFKSLIGTLQTRMINADGTGLHQLVALDSSEILPWDTPSWSPDQQRVVFMGSINLYDQNLYVMNVDGSHLVKLSQLGLYPSWSPDGKRIAYQSRHGGDIPRIYIINPDGSDEVQITVDSGAYPTWSPDSKQIVFQSNGEMANIFSINADGSNLFQITHMTDAGWPQMSPDGRSIVFVASGSEGPLQMYTINIDGSQLTQLTHSNANYSPVWSPDGKHIAFHSLRDGQMQIYVIDADGSYEIQLTHDAIQNSSPRWLS